MFKLNDKSIKFYEDLGSSQGKSMIIVLQELGALNLDESVTKQGEVMNEYMNCCNNPYYFIDKLRLSSQGGKLEPLDINITSFMSIKTMTEPTRGKANKILACYPRGTKVDLYILGYVLHQLIFTDKKIFLGGKYLSNRLKDLKDMYNNLPKFLQSVKTFETIENHIISDDDLFEKNKLNIGLIVYFGTSNEHPYQFRYSYDIPTIIENEGGDIRNFEYQFNELRNSYGFKIVKFAPKDMGLSNSFIEEAFDALNKDFGAVLKEIFMEYDPMTAEEFNNLPGTPLEEAEEEM